MRLYKRLFVLAGIAALAACDRSSPVAPDAEPDLARVLALGLRDAGVRAELRDALRASPWNEHKLVLQEFAATDAGARLVAASAKAAGVPVETVRGMIAALPESDFYMPFRDDRLTWTGGADVAVAVVEDTDAQAVAAFGADGWAGSVEGEEELGGRALLVIHAAESKGRRLSPQPAGPGLAIQDRTDGEVAGELVVTGRDGSVRSVDLADVYRGPTRLAAGPLMTMGGSCPLISYGTQTHLSGVYAYNLAEPWYRGSPEFEVDSYLSGGLVQTARLWGVVTSTNTTYCTEIVLAIGEPDASTTVTSTAYEDDSGTRDYLGTTGAISYTQNGFWWLTSTGDVELLINW